MGKPEQRFAIGPRNAILLDGSVLRVVSHTSGSSVAESTIPLPAGWRPEDIVALHDTPALVHRSGAVAWWDLYRSRWDLFADAFSVRSAR